MAKGALAILSFILILLSLLCFIMPVFTGSGVLYFFLVSFGLLIFALFSSIAGLIEGNNGLTLFSLIVSIMFLLFLVIGALLQV